MNEPKVHKSSVGYPLRRFLPTFLPLEPVSSAASTLGSSLPFSSSSPGPCPVSGCSVDSTVAEASCLGSPWHCTHRGDTWSYWVCSRRTATLLRARDTGSSKACPASWNEWSLNLARAGTQQQGLVRWQHFIGASSQMSHLFWDLLQCLRNAVGWHSACAGSCLWDPPAKPQLHQGDHKSQK